MQSSCLPYMWSKQEVQQWGTKWEARAENVDDKDIGKAQGGEDDEQVTKEQGASAAENSGGQRQKWQQPPSMTSQKETKASSKGPKIGVKKRVKIQHSTLFHILSTDKQRESIPKTTPNNHWFFGTVTANGTKKDCWNVWFDILPCDENIVANIIHLKLNVVQNDEEEKATDPCAEAFQNEEEEEEKKKKKPGPAKKSTKAFCEL